MGIRWQRLMMPKLDVSRGREGKSSTQARVSIQDRNRRPWSTLVPGRGLTHGGSVSSTVRKGTDGARNKHKWGNMHTKQDGSNLVAHIGKRFLALSTASSW